MRTAHVFTVCALVCVAIIGMTACDNMAGTLPTEPPTEPPAPPIVRGTNAVPGLNDIPMDRLLLTSNEAARNIVVLEGPSHSIDYARDELRPHAKSLRRAACFTYTVACDDPEDFSGYVIDEYGNVEVDRTDGSAPFSFIAKYEPDHDFQTQYTGFILDRINRMGMVKIVTQSIAPFSLTPHETPGGHATFAVIHSAGNGEQDRIGYPHNRTLAEEDHTGHLQAAADADLLLFVAGHASLSRTGGVYRRADDSSGCKGADDACVWTDYMIGTSVSSVKVGMGMNSVLGFFPDTESADLVRLTRACLKRSGNGIEEMLRQSGGLGVVDYTCMGALVNARDTLPAGAVTNVVVNGWTVRVGKRQLIVSR